jgi:aldose 1-epimerase
MTIRPILIGFFILVPGLLALTGFRLQAQSGKASTTRSEFGKLPDGHTIDRYTLKNRNGMEVQVLTYGGIVTSIRVPDRSGKLDDVVLGYDTMEPYIRNPSYFGAIIGRYANRIANGKFTLDGMTYTLATNNRPNHLHGGTRGFDKEVWTVSSSSPGALLVLKYRSPDGEEGYPGNVDVQVSYTLTDKNELNIQYRATADKATPINLTSHSYFNLAGAGMRDVLDHELTLYADSFTPADASLIPTGVIATVQGTPFDFRTPARIGARINDSIEQLRQASGYDHNFVVRRKNAGLVPAAKVLEPTTGRVLEVSTTEPGVQLYTANTLNAVGKSGRTYGKYSAFCLETQHYPDSPNKQQFPSTILRPGVDWKSQTVYKFSVSK